MKIRLLTTCWMLAAIPAVSVAVEPLPALYGNTAIVALSGGNYTDPASAMSDLAQVWRSLTKMSYLTVS